MKVTLEKSGSFHTYFAHGDLDSKCGMPASQEFKYDVKVEGTDEQFTPEGFLIENSKIQTYFDDTYRHRRFYRSCEQIACDAARDLAKLVSKEGAQVHQVVVTIHGTPGAKLTAVWSDADKKA